MTLKEELEALTNQLRGIKCGPSELNGHRFHQKKRREKESTDE